MLKFMIGLLTITFAVYIAVLIALYLLQGKLLFPAPGRSPVALPEAAEIFKVETVDGLEINHIRLPNRTGSPKVMFFHGNGSLASFELHRGLELNRAGYDVLLVEYRGYGGNPGSPTAEALLADSLLAFDRFVGDGHNDIYLYAHSLGTGIATHVASKRTVKALALESAYDSLAEVAASHYPIFPVKLLFRHEINAMRFAEDIKAPMLLVHGEADRVIPIEHGRKLFAGIRSAGKQWVQIPQAGHNDLLTHDTIGLAIEFFSRLDVSR